MTAAQVSLMAGLLNLVCITVKARPSKLELQCADRLLAGRHLSRNWTIKRTAQTLKMQLRLWRGEFTQRHLASAEQHEAVSGTEMPKAGAGSCGQVVQHTGHMDLQHTHMAALFCRLPGMHCHACMVPMQGGQSVTPVRAVTYL